jgi:hypothetical protein
MSTVPAVNPLISEDEIREALPKHLRNSVSSVVIDRINEVLQDNDLRENFTQNFMTYTKVLSEGRFSMDEYVNAVTYVSYKLIGLTNQDAFKQTFPNKYHRYCAEGKSAGAISSFVAAYNKTKLVNLIYEQTLIPTHVLNAHIYQEAINIQADLMRHAKSEKVRSDAANSLMTQLKRPETTKIELDVGVKQSSIIDELRDAVNALTVQQRNAIQSGSVTAGSILGEKIIQGEVVE